MYRTLAFAAALARSATGFAPAVAAPRRTALMAKYTDASGNPIKAALSAYMHFCNDERATVTAEQKRLAGDSFKQTLVMTKLGALWRELPDAQKATYNQKARRGVDINQWVTLSTSTPSSRRRNGIVVASMAWNLDAVEQAWAAQYLISTQAKEDKARYDAALKAAGVLTKAEKKAQGPKRPLSAYMHFCAERRPSLTEELKAQLGAEFKYTLVMTKLGEEWRGVGDKSKYEAMAAADKASKAA